MIMFLCNAMGTGKTLTLTLFGYVFQQTGYDIYANYKVNYPHTPINSPEEIEKIKNGVFLGDELWSWLDSRCSAKAKNRTIANILLKSRKRGFHILHTAQFFSLPDKRLREHTDLLAVPKFDELNETCSVTFYQYKGHQNVGIDPIGSFKFNAAPAYALYDSYAGIYGGDEEAPGQLAKTLE